MVGGDFLDLRDDTYAGSIFKDGSKVGDRKAGIGSNGAGPQHKSREGDDPEPVDPGRIAAALDVVDSNCPYEVWLKVAAALHHALGEDGFEVFDTWSARATGTCDDGTARYTPEKSRERWHGARTMHSITIATLFHYANEADPAWRGRYEDEERQRIFVRMVTGDGGAGGKADTSPDASQGQQGAGQASQQGPAPFELFWHGKEYNRELRSWLVKEMIPETGLGLASGQWGTAKTFAVLDLAASVMTAAAFAGREVSRRGGVLFIAAEGAYEIPIRLKGVVEEKLRPAALGGAAELASLPFAWIEDCPNLQDNGDFNRLLATAKQAARNIRDQFDLPLALIVIDTLSAVGNFKDANDAAEGQRIMNRLGELGRQDRRLRSRRRSLRQGGGDRHARQLRQGGRRRCRAGAAGRSRDQRHRQQHAHGAAEAPRRQGRHRNAVRSEGGQSGVCDDMRRGMEGGQSAGTGAYGGQGALAQVPAHLQGGSGNQHHRPRQADAASWRQRSLQGCRPHGQGRCPRHRPL